jgi:HSP20 family protein
MTTEISMNPGMGVLPFEMFRSFAPTFDKNKILPSWTPLCDIYETDTEIVLKIELPNMKKEDVNVALEKNVLTLRGERKFEETVNRESYHRIERKYGAFMRCFRLPTRIEGSKVLAEFKEGTLTVTFPKSAAAMKSREQKH